MQKIKYYLEKYKIIILIIISLLIILFGFFLYKNLNNYKNVKISTDTLTFNLDKQLEIEETVKIEKVKVDIKGQINSPGVYEMNSNERIIDVIYKAGGLTDKANTEYINLSKKITDEMIIIIYSNEEMDSFKLKNNDETIYIKYECECPDNINDSCINETDTVNTNGVEKKDDILSDKTLISINSDDIDELIKLDGIGELKAKKIIEYRKEFGDFKVLEDIMNVPGIGESAYSKIKDYIKL